MSDAYAPNNFLPLNNFKFEIPGLDNFNAHILSVNLPTVGGQVAAPGAGVSTPFSALNLAGDRLEFGDLNVKVKIDEAMMAYQEVATWLFAIGFPSTFQQYTTLGTSIANTPTPYKTGTLTILDAREEPFIQFTFNNIYPTGIGEIVFDSTPEDVQYAETTMSFKYQYYTFQTLSNGAVSANNVSTL